jgi:NDP-sugar pyrophosphorylase family protein/CRISPR/Cas system-associated exonuclease Cas4 (RecB family)
LKALIFAAGLGTRLQEYTKKTPKALVEVNGKSMLQMTIESLKAIGISDIFINIHHFGEQIIHYLETHNNFNCNIQISDERDLLLNTGGGLKKVLQELNENEDLLIHNVDILTNFDLKKFIKFHQKNKNLASLLVKKRKTSRYLLFDEKMNLKAWTNINTGEIRPEEMQEQAQKFEAFAFSGIHIINQSALKHFPETDVFEIIPEYLKMAQREKIMALEMKCSMWMDLGKPESLKKAADYLERTKIKSFIDEMVSTLNQAVPQKEFIQSCIITPNQRAKRLIKNTIIEQNPNGGFFPEILSIDEFVFKWVPFYKLDETELIFRLYPIVQKQISEETSFDDFLNYATTLLQDFNELDMNLVSGEKIFNYLSEAKAIQQWNPDGRELSPGQKEYLNFYNQLAGVYKTFTEKLTEESACYQGMAYRYLAEHAELIEQLHDWNHIFIAGFNALTTSEEAIIKALTKHKKTHLLWDADAYYFKDTSMEAGLYLRKHSKWTGSIVEQLQHHFSQKQKEINIIGSPGVLGQARLAAQILVEQQEKDVNFMNQTAVVPADENLLLALLNSMPYELLNCTNITMGFPLGYTHSFQLTDRLLQLHISAQKLSQLNKNQYRIIRDELLDILNNDLLNLLSNKSDKENFHPRFLSDQAISAILAEYGLLDIDFLFKNPENNAFQLNNQLSRFFMMLIDLLSKEENKTQHAQELDACIKISDVLKRLENLLIKQTATITLISFQKLFKQIIRQSKQSFVGQINTGLQLMGLLESRLMDFKNVILLSVNEDILPSSSFTSSFIPYDIKYEFDLPGHQEKTAVYAYHFYRLIQRAEKVFLLYSTSKRQLSGGEKSRFLKQLEYELTRYNPNIIINQQLLSFDAPEMAGQAIEIEKDEAVMAKLRNLAENGFSPTSINTYIKCPLQFYFNKIARIREPEQNEEIIDERMFGNIIHDFLEKEYAQFYKDQWSVERLEYLRSHITDLLPQYFKSNHFKGNLDEGANYLDYKNIIHYLDRFLQYEIAQEKKHPGKLKIQELEGVLERDLDLQDGTKVKFSGRADRIDMLNGNLRILDYKTGNVKKEDLKIVTTRTDHHEKVFFDEKYEKIVQLFLYKWMYGDVNRTDVEMGIVSFRNIMAPYLMLENNHIRFDELENNFKILMEEIFNSDLSFVQTHNQETCKRCIYNHICQK